MQKKMFPNAFPCVLLLVCANSLAYQLTDSDGKRHFQRHSVVRAVPTNAEQLALLQSLVTDPGSELDSWIEPSFVYRPVDIMVPPQKYHNLLQILKKYKIPQSISVDDVERIIDSERNFTRNELTSRNLESFFAQYQRLDVIHSFMDKLASSKPTITSILSIGKSTEGKDLKVIKIGSKSEGKPIIWMEGGMHAREWISPATVTYIAHQLVQKYDSDADVKTLVDTYDWYILPVTNPDGYEYSHTTNRLWRKNRSATKSFWGCKGVDLNRNWGYKWMSGGSSSNPCSDIYAGPNPFSEPETRAVSNFVLNLKDKVKAFLDVHSYSQVWLTPWGWTTKLPDNYEELEAVAKEAVKALSGVHSTNYEIGSSTNTLGLGSGGADDWAYGSAAIKYVYTIELRDKGNNGFLLPSEQILPTGQETWAGVKAMALTILKRQL